MCTGTNNVKEKVENTIPNEISFFICFCCCCYFVWCPGLSNLFFYIEKEAGTGFIQKGLQGFFQDFSRTTLDFQGPPTRNIISQTVQKCTFPILIRL